MTRTALLVLLISIMAFSAQGRQDPAKGTIEGVVVSLSSSQPIEDVRLSLRPDRTALQAASPIEPVLPIATGADGRFVFSGLRPGTYRLELSSNGYVRQLYGQRTFPGEGTPIEVTAGQTIKGLAVSMTPVGSISGRVRDKDTNQPLASVPVRLLRFEYGSNGQRVRRQYGSARTDDKGEYRIYFVTPGRYYLNAGGSLTRTPEERIRESNAIIGTYSSMFYPDAAGSDGALTLDVKPGADLAGIEFHVRKQEVYRITGKVIDSITGQPPPSANSSVYRLTDSAWERMELPSNYRTSDGAFEFRGLVSGSYLLLVTASTSPQRMLQNLPSPAAVPQFRTVAFPVRPLQAAQENVRLLAGSATRVEISGSDREGIVVTMTSGLSIAGSVAVEQQASLPQVFSRLQIRVSGFNGVLSKSAPVPPPVRPNTGAPFRIDGITPGEYRVSVTGLPPGTFVKELRLGGLNALQNAVQISEGENRDLSIVISPNVSAIDGVVRNNKLEPAAGSKVVLVPDRDRDRTELFQTSTANPAGQFQFSNVVPGNYRVFAWEAIEPYAYFDPELLRQVEAKGKAIQVEESSKQNVAVTVISVNN